MNKKRVISLVLALTMVLATGLSVFAQITDVDRHWAEKEIRYMVDTGLIQGYEDSTFRPDENITNAEFYKVISDLVGNKARTESKFKDVKSSDWFYEHIEKGLAAGYIINSNYLYPNELINREKVAEVIARVYDLDFDEESVKEFEDVDEITLGLRKYVGALKSNGYISGYKDGTFRPKNNITRAELVMMLYNIIKVEGKPDIAEPIGLAKPVEPVKEVGSTSPSYDYKVEDEEAKADKEDQAIDKDLSQENIIEAAERAVYKAEESAKQEDVDFARSIVKDIKNSFIRASFNHRLDQVQKAIMQGLIDGLEEEIIEDNKDFGDRDDEIDYSEIDKELEKVAQENIIEAAERAVYKAEESAKQEDVDFARKTVKDIKDSFIRASFNYRLDQVQKFIMQGLIDGLEEEIIEDNKDFGDRDEEIDYSEIDKELEKVAQENIIEAAERAVYKAEESAKQEDVDFARSVVKDIKNSFIRASFNYRLDQVQKFIIKS